jgi:hypothetical protein
LPVVVTNHTVTIAAELVKPLSIHCRPWALIIMRSIFLNKEDGRKLVGQCEISHPVPQDPTPDITVSDPLSPVNGMGEVIISQRQNIMFEAESKGDYEPMGSRISRTL